MWDRLMDYAAFKYFIWVLSLFVGTVALTVCFYLMVFIIQKTYILLQHFLPLSNL